MKFLADENFDNDTLRGIWRRIPDANFTRVQDTEIAGADDPRVLEYAVEHEYILLTHDVNTMRGFFYERLKDGLSVPGVFLVHKSKPIRSVIDDLELIILTTEASEWKLREKLIQFMPNVDYMLYHENSPNHCRAAAKSC